MNQKILDAVKGRDDADKIFSGLHITETTQASEQVLNAIAQTIKLTKAGMRIEEATAKAYGSKVKSLAKTESTAIQAVEPDSVPMPDGLKNRLDTISKTQAADGAPEAKDALAETFSGVSEKTLEAITGYAAHSYQQALMNELNKPEFLDDLEKAIAEGKSQT